MMPGFRTPNKVGTGTTAKSPTMTQKAGPSGVGSSATGVRKSIGEIEARQKPPTSPKKKVIPGKGSDVLVLQESVEPGQPSRSQAAKRLLMSAKSQLNNARNLKTEIKTAVIEAVEGLFGLVKDAENEGKGKGKEEQKTPPTNDPIEDVDELKTELRKHSKVIRDTRAQMEALGLQMEGLSATVRSEMRGEFQRLHSTAAIAPAELTVLGSRVAELTESLAREPSTKPLEDLKNQVGELDKLIRSGAGQVVSQMTYAEKAAIPKQPMQAVHSIVISSSEDTDTSDDIINKIKKVVDAKASGIRVDRIRKAKDQKVVVGCEDREELNKIKNKLECSTTKFNVEERQNKDPLVVLRDVLASNTNEDILMSLKTQNSHIVGHIPTEEYRAQVRYRKKARNPYETHVVLQVSPTVWQRLTAAGKVHVDLQRVTVKDQSPVVQCSRCLGYGHGRKLCTEAEDKCSHCSGCHMRSECPARLTGDPPECINCKLAKLEHYEHNSFDDGCPVRKKWDMIARSSVAYC